MVLTTLTTTRVFKCIAKQLRLTRQLICTSKSFLLFVLRNRVKGFLEIGVPKKQTKSLKSTGEEVHFL